MKQKKQKPQISKFLKWSGISRHLFGNDSKIRGDRFSVENQAVIREFLCQLPEMFDEFLLQKSQKRSKKVANNAKNSQK